jgi:hypothetical protein
MSIYKGSLVLLCVFGLFLWGCELDDEETTENQDVVGQLQGAANSGRQPVTRPIDIPRDILKDIRTVVPAFFETGIPKRGGVQVALNTGSAFQNDGMWNEYFCVDDEICQVGDVTGDGKDDIIAFTKKGPVYVAIAGDGVNASAAAKPFRNSKIWHNDFCKPGERCLLGDVNGDGKKDIIALADGGDILVAYSDGQKFGNSVSRGNWTNVCRSNDRSCEFGDVNGDGSVDLVGAFHCDEHWVTKTAIFYVNNFFTVGDDCPAATPTGLPGRFLRDIDVGDVTGDNKADVVIFTDGDVYVAPSQFGTSREVFPTASLWLKSFRNLSSLDDFALADISGDSKLDIVAITRGKKGEIRVAPSKGNRFGEVSIYAGITEENRFCTDRQVCRLGNVDGMGKADVVAFHRGTARPVATRVAPKWQPQQSHFDFSTCRNNAAKVGITKVRDLPPEIQESILWRSLEDYEGGRETSGWTYWDFVAKDFNLDTEVIVYVAPRDPSNISRTTNLTDALAAAAALNGRDVMEFLPVVVVAEEVQLSGVYPLNNSPTLVLVAQSIVSDRASFDMDDDLHIVAESVSGQFKEYNYGHLKEIAYKQVSSERFFQIAATVADEPIIVDTYLAQTDSQFRTGVLSGMLALGYYAGKSLLSNSSRSLPDSLSLRLTAIEAIYDSRIVQLSGGLDIVGTSPNVVDALSKDDAKSAADYLIANLDKLSTDYYLQQIKNNGDSLSTATYGTNLEQAIGTVGALRSEVANESLAEMQSRLTAAKSNLDRANIALEAAKARQSSAEAALEGTGFFSVVKSLASLYPPASAFFSFADSAIDAAKGATQSNIGESSATPGKKSATDWLKEGAKKGYELGSKLGSAWSAISSFSSKPECQTDANCRAFMLDVEAAVAEIRTATSELDAAGHAVAAAESNVRLVKAERDMYLASAEKLLSEKERAERRAQAFCTLAQGKLDTASLAVNMYRRIRALHDAPLDPNNPAYNSKRYDYAMLYDFDKTSIMQQTLREAMSATEGQPRAWRTDEKIVVGASSDGELFAQLLRESMSKEGDTNQRIEVDFRLVEGANGRTTLHVGPSESALANGAPPVWLESAKDLKNSLAIQALDFKLQVTSSRDGVLYDLPAKLRRTTANPIVLTRNPRTVQEMSLSLGINSASYSDDLIQTGAVGTYMLNLDQTDRIPWRYYESLDKTWTLVIDICSLNQTTNGVCIDQEDLNSITKARLTINIRYKYDMNV